MLKSWVKLPVGKPFTIVARTVTVPALGTLSTLPLMVAPVVPALCTLHVIFLFVALTGITVPPRTTVPVLAVVGISVILLTPTMPTTMLKS